MKIRLCSHDMFAVPDACYVLKDAVGSMYFCNLRCLCVWSVQRATRADLSEEEKSCAYSLTTPLGEEHLFAGLVEAARWAAVNALR